MRTMVAALRKVRSERRVGTPTVTTSVGGTSSRALDPNPVVLRNHLGQGSSQITWHLVSATDATTAAPSGGAGASSDGGVRATEASRRPSAVEPSAGLDAYARWHAVLESAMRYIEEALTDVFRFTHAAELGSGSYQPRLAGDVVTIRDLSACVPRLQRAGSLWPEAFFALCRMAQCCGQSDNSTASSGLPGVDSALAMARVPSVVLAGVNILQLIMGVRRRVAFLVDDPESQRMGLLAAQEAAVRNALALLPVRDGHLARLLRLQGIGGSDRGGRVKTFLLPAVLFYARGGGLQPSADERSDHALQRSGAFCDSSVLQHQAVAGAVLEMIFSVPDVSMYVPDSRGEGDLPGHGAHESLMGGDGGMVTLSAEDLKRLTDSTVEALDVHGSRDGLRQRVGAAGVTEALKNMLSVTSERVKRPPAGASAVTQRRAWQDPDDVSTELVSGVAGGLDDGVVLVDGLLTFTPDKKMIRELLANVSHLPPSFARCARVRVFVGCQAVPSDFILPFICRQPCFVCFAQFSLSMLLFK
jgi:hypothetical protein